MRFENKTEKYIYPNGEEYTFLPDGTVQMINKDNVKLIEQPDRSKVAIFPNGVQLKVDPDGSITTTVETD
jgi:hypothetical protein